MNASLGSAVSSVGVAAGFGVGLLVGFGVGRVGVGVAVGVGGSGVTVGGRGVAVGGKGVTVGVSVSVTATTSSGSAVGPLQAAKTNAIKMSKMGNGFMSSTPNLQPGGA